MREAIRQAEREIRQEEHKERLGITTRDDSVSPVLSAEELFVESLAEVTVEIERMAWKIATSKILHPTKGSDHMRTEQQIEDKIDKALKAKEQPTMGNSYAYLCGVREALGWVLEEDDLILGLDED